MSRRVWFVDSPDAEAFHLYADCAALQQAVQPVIVERIPELARTVHTARFGNLYACERCSGRVNRDDGGVAWAERAETCSATGVEAIEVLRLGEAATADMLRGGEPLRVFKENFCQLRVFVDRIEISRSFLSRGGGGEPVVIPIEAIRTLRPVSWIPVFRSAAIEIDFEAGGEVISERFELDKWDSPELLIEAISGLKHLSLADAPSHLAEGTGKRTPKQRPLGGKAGSGGGGQKSRSKASVSRTAASATRKALKATDELAGETSDEIPSWTAADELNGSYDGRLNIKMRKGSLTTTGNCSFVGMISLERTEDYLSDWKGKLTGRLEYKVSHIYSPRKFNDIDRIEEYRGLAKAEVVLQIWGDNIYLKVGKIKVAGRFTLKKDGASEVHQDTYNSTPPGEGAVSDRWGGGGPAEFAGTSTSGSHTLKPEPGIVETVKWTIRGFAKNVYPRTLNKAEKKSWRENRFPEMDVESVIVTGNDQTYNCMGFVLGIPKTVWPASGASTNKEALEALFVEHGWIDSDDGDLVAVWANDAGAIYHVSKVRPDGWHESKFGTGGFQMIHRESDLLRGRFYPNVKIFYTKRGRRVDPE